MRLDQFLKLSRMVTRRSVAQEFCDSGLIDVNGARAKSAKEIKVGDEIEIRRRQRVTRIRVKQLPTGKQVAKNAASELYDLISETVVGDELI
jgi:ribosomal 50S subunit-recycling heat shock protein